MDSTGVWGAIVALVTGVTSKGAWDYFKQRKEGDEKRDNALIEAKDEFIADLQKRYLRLEDRITELHDNFIQSEKERANLSGRIVELEGRVEELELENKILRAENNILKNK